MSGAIVSTVEVLRGDVVESRHRVSIAVVGGAGALLAWSGDPDRLVYARSAIKPMQALPLVDDGVADRFGFTDAELALACASHSGEPFHVDAARSMLRKAGVDENALACGPHAPYSQAAASELAARGEAPGRVHNNCSGKHAGMLALARAHDWPLAGYHEMEHPVQQRMLAELCRWSGTAAEQVQIAVDGCGVATFALPLRSLATAFATLARAAHVGVEGPSRIVAAMATHPEMVGGTDRLCTRVLRASGGSVFLKVGAEGVYCAASPEADVGLALKVEDGAGRAAEPALLAALGRLGLLDDGQLEMLRDRAEPVIRNTRGEVVGVVRTSITMQD
ncbi:MAG: asparaginase [Gemmatimonadota bacterium]